MMETRKKASEMTQQELARYVDFSILKPEFTEEEVVKLTKQCVELECFNACINPAHMELCLPLVKGTKTKLSPVLDFPFGACSTAMKIQMAKQLCEYPEISEIDMVANIGLIRAHEYDRVSDDIRPVAEVIHNAGYQLKVILETDTLTEDEIRHACHAVVNGNADFVKTSTGFITGYNDVGAAPETIQIMLDEVGDQIKVKGSGHIRTREHFLKLIDMGVSRMGVGYKSVPIVLGIKQAK